MSTARGRWLACLLACVLMMGCDALLGIEDVGSAAPADAARAADAVPAPDAPSPPDPDAAPGRADAMVADAAPEHPTDGLQPISASSSQQLINNIFRVSAPSPNMPFGQFNDDASVTATPDSGYFKILFELGDEGVDYTVTTTVVGASNNRLSEWSWYRDACCFAGIRSVWTRDGWADIDAGSISDAIAVDARYYYRIELDAANVNDALGAFIASQGAAATVTFYGI